MHYLFLSTLLFLLFNFSMTQAQTSNPEGHVRVVKASAAAGPSATDSINENPAAFSLSKIDDSVVKAFQLAWKNSGNGTLSVEGVVLIFANPDGSYKALLESYTNQSRKFSFKWNPAILAIVHTHPNDNDPKPSRQDLALADRFGVPIFTLTGSGMFMYDPSTRKISKIKDRLNWSKSSSWASPQPMPVNR